MTWLRQVPSVRRWFAVGFSGVTATALAAPARAGFGRHTHDAFVVSRVTAGIKRIVSKAGDRLIAPGVDLLFVPPCTSHAVESGQDGFAHRALVFEPACLAALLDGEGVVPAADLPMFLESDPRFGRAFDGLHRAIAAGEKCLHLQLDALLHQFGAALTARHAASNCSAAGSGDGRAARRARSIIEARLGEKIALVELAEASGTTPLRLLRAFDRAFGLPPHAFQLQARIRCAQDMLKRGLPPAFVAADLGFVDQSHFTRQFRRLAGTTPGAYARAARS